MEKSQKKVFVEMIQLAKKVDLPLNMHCGQAHEEMVDIIFSEGVSKWSKRYTISQPT